MLQQGCAGCSLVLASMRQLWHDLQLLCCLHSVLARCSSTCSTHCLLVLLWGTAYIILLSLCCRLAAELAIGNIVRRVLHMVREEQQQQSLEQAQRLPAAAAQAAAQGHQVSW